MTTTRQERRRAATIAEIKGIAHQHMASKGAAALSLRAIAREMDMTSPALYRYFASRDDLVTALIVDVYHAFARALRDARDEAPEDDHALRLLATAHAYRTWALAHPADYNLIFGTPIPGYHAPVEITGPAAAQSMFVFIGVLDAAYQAGQLEVDMAVDPALLAMLQPWIDKLGYGGPPAIIRLALAGWAQIHGLVSLELFGHLSPEPGQGDAGALFEAEIVTMVARLEVGNNQQSTKNIRRSAKNSATHKMEKE